MKDLSKMSLKELVAFWNENNPDNQIKRFSDRGTAERRCAALQDEVVTEVILDEDDVVPSGQENRERHSATTKRRRSHAIADSWNDSYTHELRCQRSAVEVDGVKYSSVAKAFKALDLPMKKHIKFRMMLKDRKTAQAFGRSWKIIPRNY